LDEYRSAMNLLRADTKFPNTVYMGGNIRTQVDNPRIKIEHKWIIQESKYILVNLPLILF